SRRNACPASTRAMESRISSAIAGPPFAGDWAASFQGGKRGVVLGGFGGAVLVRRAKGQVQVGGKAAHRRAVLRQHVVNARDKKLFICAGVQVFLAGGGVGLFVFEIVRTADGVAADDLFFHRAADVAVRPVLQVAVRRRVAGKGQQRAGGAGRKRPRRATIVERAAQKQADAVVGQQRLAAGQPPGP